MFPAPRPRWTCLAVSLFLLGASAHAQTVYTWKDAKGVTHYSDAPPKQAKVAVRTMSVPAAPAAAASAATAPAAVTAATAARTANEAAGQTRCAQARANLAALQGTAPVGLDADRDGKPDSPLGADDRAAQIASMQAVIQRDCSGG